MIDLTLHKAIEFATIKHAGQLRKGTEIPYIVHPVEVMQILTAEGCTQDIIVAGILHDTVEDTATSIDEIRDLFGERVAMLVMCESEDKSKTWRERKQNTIDHLKQCERDVAICTMADKLSNARSLLYDYKRVGDKLWERFNQPYESEKWYYTEIMHATEYLNDTKLWQEFADIVNQVFK